MPFSSGVYTLPNPALVTGEVVSATENNTTRNDLAGALNLTMLRNGTSTATANLPMGGYKLTGLGVATTSGDALSYGQVAVISDFTASGTVTISSGTANGVAYLNGSKVLTTGSALTFDGTDLNLGSGSVQNLFNINGGTTGGAIRGQRAGVNKWFIGDTAAALGSGTGFISFNYGAEPWIWQLQTGGEQMRLTSTGLGIGTSSPVAKLSVYSTSAGGAFANIYDASNSSGANPTLQFGVYNSNGFNASDAARVWATAPTISTAALNFAAYNGGFPTTSQMTLTGGNLGLGVTPSAWTTYKAFDIGGGQSVTGYQDGATNSIALVANAFWDGSWKYKQSIGASRYTLVNNAHAWYNAPSGTAGAAITFTQAMTLDASGNLGIGTSSPNGKLHVYQDTTGTTSIRIQNPNTGGGANTALLLNGDSGEGSVIVSSAAGGDAMAVRADSNLSGGLYLDTIAAAPIILRTNFTERMRIDSSGNVFVGGTTALAGSKEAVYGDTSNQGSGTYPATLELIDTRAYNSTSPQAGGGVAFGYKYTSGGNYALGPSIQGFKENITDGNYAAGLKFSTRPNGSNPAEAMRIDSSGNVGIGTSSPNAKITVKRSGAGLLINGDDGNVITYIADTTGDILSYGTYSSHPVAFRTNNTERMRIDSSGNLLVGKTTNADSTVGASIMPSGRIAGTMAASTNAQDTLTVFSTGASAYRFYVGMGGTVYATSTTISAISDQRYKENVRDLDVGLNAVMALKPRVFDWKEGKGKNIKNDHGFIAQEFEQVFPDLIDEWKDPAPKGEEPYKSVRQDLIPVLVKAIQELKAELDATKAEVAALKGK